MRGALSACGINRGLRTLRCPELAFQVEGVGQACQVALAAGERQRDRVLIETEINKYLDDCRQP